MMLDVFGLEFFGYSLSLKGNRNLCNGFFLIEQSRDLFKNRIADDDGDGRKIKRRARRTRRRIVAVDRATKLCRADGFCAAIFCFLFAAFHRRHTVFRIARKDGRSRQQAGSEREKQEKRCQPFFHL